MCFLVSTGNTQNKHFVEVPKMQVRIIQKQQFLHMSAGGALSLPEMIPQRDENALLSKECAKQ